MVYLNPGGGWELCSSGPPLLSVITQVSLRQSFPLSARDFVWKGVNSLDWDKIQEFSSAVRCETLTVLSSPPAILIAENTGWVEKSPAQFAPNRAVRETWVESVLGALCSPCPQWHQKVFLYLRFSVSCVSHSCVTVTQVPIPAAPLAFLPDLQTGAQPPC